MCNSTIGFGRIMPRSYSNNLVNSSVNVTHYVLSRGEKSMVYNKKYLQSVFKSSFFADNYEELIAWQFISATIFKKTAQARPFKCIKNYCSL